ncbi:thioester domain-containing protein [Dactylosporangium sucinum]|uniref:Thioester domain-containing protein n=1 Tax=Dactylosporangium sucinum TaxID=1424081 RepID=A0A917WNK7_9ACTN|nr:thioester domain-containing protein [Dactylosporangium sucinum]GGM17474.1 hypothetical protein GCM10007977_018370 [Dactylosporangium sucinum]
MSSIPRWAAAAGALLAGGALALSGAGAAAAETTPVTGTQVYLDTPQQSVKIINAKQTDAQHPNGTEALARRLGLKVAGSDETVLAYCIDYKHDIKDPKYVEGSWAPNKNGTPTPAELSQVQWVLTHSYPVLGVDAVIAAAKATKPADTSDELLTKLVYAGTQSAIWTLTDGDAYQLRDSNDGFNTTPNAAADQYGLIVAINDYLVNASKSPAEEPQPKLVINPATLSGEAGKKIGPFTVESGGGLATLTATGGSLVDADGKPVTELSNGGKFYVVADAPGEVTVNAKGSGSVPIGRVFVAKVGPDEFQKLILAGVAGTELEASAKVTVTPPVPHLPVTGVKLTGAITAGVLLVAGGVALLMVVRRRRVRFTA